MTPRLSTLEIFEVLDFNELPGAARSLRETIRAAYLETSVCKAHYIVCQRWNRAASWKLHNGPE